MTYSALLVPLPFFPLPLSAFPLFPLPLIDLLLPPPFCAAETSWIANGALLFILPLPVLLIARCGGGPDQFFLSSSATFRSSVATFCWSALLLELLQFAIAKS